MCGPENPTSDTRKARQEELYGEVKVDVALSNHRYSNDPPRQSRIADVVVDWEEELCEEVKANHLALSSHHYRNGTLHQPGTVVVVVAGDGDDE
jgi:hypothetical protein